MTVATLAPEVHRNGVSADAGTLAPEPASPPSPSSVCIVAMGGSATSYLLMASSLGGRHAVADEVWAINAMGGIIEHDRLFAMDDFKRILERDADKKKIAGGMMKWLSKHPGPIYTSRAYPLEYPGTVEYPLTEVLNTLGGSTYLNNSVAYAVAYAMHIGVKKIMLYGCDFSYPDPQYRHVAEAGRSCVEFLLGLAAAGGIEIEIPDGTTLLDFHTAPERRFYGYADGVNVTQIDGVFIATPIRETECKQNDTSSI